MQILDFNIERYSDSEGDLCRRHKVSEDDDHIEHELEHIQSSFAAAYPQLKIDTDYEFPPWHHHLRLFWAYLYSDAFYTEDFLPLVGQLLSAMPRSWFAEFECYSPSLKSPEKPTGWAGDFLVFKDTVIFCNMSDHQEFKAKLGV